MPAPICVKCEIEMRTKTNGVPLIETYEEDRKPYKLWMGDLWYCEKCGIEVIVGFGYKPLAGNWDDDFKERIVKEVKLAKGNAYYSHERRFVL